MPEPWLRVENLDFRIGSFRLRRVNLACARGEYHVLLGPTGSGKSTLIKCLLGLQRPQAGRILLAGENIVPSPPERRGLGYLPQHHALFPHLDVAANIRFGLKGKTEAGETLLRRLVDMLKLEPLLRRGVRDLSGGERQKVALARALAARPQLILLDEPFSSIDPGERRLLWFETRRAITELGITALHITHDLDEAHLLGERLTVMIEGAVAQSGTRAEIFARPATAAVARFLGYRNISSGKTTPGPGGSVLETGSFRLVLNERLPAGEQASVCVRPQDIKVIREDAPIQENLKENIFSGTIAALYPLPELCLLHFRIAGSPEPFDLELRFPVYIRERLGLREGQKIRVGIWKPGIVLFPDPEPGA